MDSFEGEKLRELVKKEAMSDNTQHSKPKITV